MDITHFNYHLPSQLIAQSPASPRDSSNLLVIDRENQTIAHRIFRDLDNLLSNNDVLVFNQTRVFPARLLGNKTSGGKVEILLLKDKGNNCWEAIFKGKVRSCETILFNDFPAVINNVKGNLIEIKFQTGKENLFNLIEKHGLTPLPPYIKSTDKEISLRKKYQTIYAIDTGSAAAPTAGLHFTSRLIESLKNKGVGTEYLTLHVGLGTFAPVKEKDITKHKIHSEYFSLDQETANGLNLAKAQGKRIIAVGTTTTRVLESCVNDKGVLIPSKGTTELFIYPPYKFKFIDALITNFHLPKSTLLALVTAFVTHPNTNEKFKDFNSSLIGYAYQEAINNNYRFFSFGDATLIV